MELVGNNNFDTPLGWVCDVGGAVSGGKLTATSMDPGFAIGQRAPEFPTVIGKTYRVSFTVESLTPRVAGGGISVRVGSDDTPVVTAPGFYTFLIVATTSTQAIVVRSRLTIIDSAVIDGISVREVLEFGNGLKFDGVSDSLSVQQTTSALTQSTLIVAGKCVDFSQPRTFSCFASGPLSGVPRVSQIRAMADGSIQCMFRNDAAQASTMSAYGEFANRPVVLSCYSDAVTANFRANGYLWQSSLIPSGPYTLDNSTIGSLDNRGSQPFRGDITLVCQSKNKMPIDDIISIEKFAAYLAGVENYVG